MIENMSSLISLSKSSVKRKRRNLLASPKSQILKKYLFIIYNEWVHMRGGKIVKIYFRKQWSFSFNPNLQSSFLFYVLEKASTTKIAWNSTTLGEANFNTASEGREAIILLMKERQFRIKAYSSIY